MKIGIMGGTFDPIHIGHLILGETAYRECGLDRVVYMPAGNPPHKRHRSGGADDLQRVEMVRLATEGNPHFSVSDWEMHRTGYTYTWQTLEGMHTEYPGADIYFLLGEDSLADFPKWREPEKICSLCTLAVAVRHEGGNEHLKESIRYAEETWQARICLLHSPNIDVSSSMLREMVSLGQSVRYYVPEQVRRYIEENGLYRSI